MSWLLILYIGMTPNGTPRIIVKPFDNRQKCMEHAGLVDVNERLNDNYGVWFECIERSK